MEILAFILSLLGLAGVAGASLIKGNRMKLPLLLLFCGNVLFALSYTLSGSGINGAASGYLGSLFTLVNYFFTSRGQKFPRWLPYLYEVLFIAVNVIFGTDLLLTAVAIAATVTFVIGIVQPNGAKYRFWTAINLVLWVIFDLLALSYGTLVSHIILLLSTLLGIFLHDRKKEHA
jgi:hypothetical protein